MRFCIDFIFYIRFRIHNKYQITIKHILLLVFSEKDSSAIAWKPRQLISISQIIIYHDNSEYQFSIIFLSNNFFFMNYDYTHQIRKSNLYGRDNIHELVIRK